MMTLEERGSVKAERLALPTCAESDKWCQPSSGFAKGQTTPVVGKAGQEKNVR